jgi:hypothetical protein
MTTLSNRSGVVLEKVQIASEIATILRAKSPMASCASYGTLSKRAQSPSNENPEYWR